MGTLDIFQKCDGFGRARQLQELGMYPYFIPLHGSEGTEVEIAGKRLIMIGSNNYLGLTHHPQVREAAIQAIRQYGTSCSPSRRACATAPSPSSRSARRKTP
jgi:7-keto-8-aminopelargonate synthetase-like enzyme